MSKNRRFWPSITYLDSNGESHKISTSNPCVTFEEAWNQITDYWRDGYGFNIQDATIDIYNDYVHITTVNMSGILTSSEKARFT